MTEESGEMATVVGSDKEGDSGPLRSSAVQERAKKQAIITGRSLSRARRFDSLKVYVTDHLLWNAACLPQPSRPSPLPLGELNMASTSPGRYSKSLYTPLLS